MCAPAAAGSVSDAAIVARAILFLIFLLLSVVN
jgi:hypothetical protein